MELALAAVVGADRWPGCGWYVHRSVWADFLDHKVAGAGDLDRMAASADRVWDLASDITRVGEISPETFEAEWPGGASGPEAGARFRGHVPAQRLGPVYWTVCTVVACDPGREFAFAVAGPGGMTVNTLALPAGTQRGVPTSPSRLSWPTRRSYACTG